MQINDNFKLIRELSGIKQTELAPLLKIKLSTWKSYENTDIRPKANVITAVAKFSGIEPEDLDKKLSYKDFKFKDKKDRKSQETNGNAPKPEDKELLRYDGSFSVQDLLAEKEARRKESLERAEVAEREKDRLLRILESNLDKAQVGIDTLQYEVYSVRQVALKSLARIENPKGPEDVLLKEADNIVKKMRGNAGKKDKHD